MTWTTGLWGLLGEEQNFSSGNGKQHPSYGGGGVKFKGETRFCQLKPSFLSHPTIVKLYHEKYVGLVPIFLGSEVTVTQTQTSFVTLQ